MPNYMAELILTDRKVLLVGGGEVARRKLAGLLACQAEVLIVAPRLDPEVAEWVQQQKVHHQPGLFSPEILDQKPGFSLVFAATSQAETNREIALLCAKRGLLCNSADDPKVSGFLVPAMIRRGPVTLGVGTQGESPALSRLLKERLDGWLEPGWEDLTRLFGAMRQQVKERVHPLQKRQIFWRETALAAEREERFLKKENLAWFEKRLDEVSSE
ncbi:MAG: bifunctional precorrin-2 dehydrogenase/sirohydrochlorin ferrochelatase [Magnetococcales bacterium]|nr:bifunctional precorrin-2 dehydrogenase/sirohydrochlorin ferrochelatase [Magnetococcales bacterium]